MISKHFDETLSIYCGGIDNLFRHHDYTRAILESVRPYPMAKYWLHCHHLHVDGKKMSKSRGNIYYTDNLLEQAYAANEIRFFLIYGHYRERLNYSDRHIQSAVVKLRRFREIARLIEASANEAAEREGRVSQSIQRTFTNNMNNDLNVRGAFDRIYGLFSQLDVRTLRPSESRAIVNTLKGIDEVLKVIY